MGVKPLTLRSTSVDGSEGAMSAPAPGGRRLERHLSADQLESSPAAAAGSADGSTSAKSDDKIWRPMFSSTSELENPQSAGEEVASFEERKAQVLLTLLPPEQLRDMRVVFDMFDDDGGGTVSTAEVGITLRRQKLVASRKMLRTILAAIDVNGDGEIDFGEFVTLMTQRSKVVEHDVDEDDGEEPPADLTASPRTLEALASPRQPKAEIQDAEEQAQAIRQFKRAISHLAFGSHMTSNPTSPRAMEELDRVKAQLGVKKEMRTEWELQRVLIFMERFEFIQELPPAEDSDQRIDACRVLGVQEVEPGDRSVPSTRLAIVLCIFWAWRFAFADGAFPQDLPGRGQRRDDVLPAARFSGAEIEAAANGGRGHPRPAADHAPAGGQELRRICRHEHLPGEPREA